MPTKREVLAVLGRDDLLTCLDHVGLEVSDRRVKDDLVEALAASKRARLDEMLTLLSRKSLKGAARALGLDDSGKEKAALVERLAGVRAAKNGAPTNGAAVNPEPVAPDCKLTTEALERYLWSAADILRGQIDSGDYKNFIFGLLFLKRLSDRFEEEAEKAIHDGVSERVAWEDETEHQFFVPKRARWNELQRVATNVGEALNKATAALEEANPKALEGVLAGIDYNDERKLGDARNRDNLLLRLIQHFSQVSLRNADLSEPDMLGRAYEYLIERFADDAGKKGGEFYTPKKVVELIVALLAPEEGMRICDPTCGSGGMLIECAKHIEKHGGNPRNLTLHGQEKNLGTWSIAKMNMLLHGIADHRIEKGDTIRDPKLVDGGELMLYDRVIANPPFSLDEWGREAAENDVFGRFRFGIPPKGKGDLAFVQHMVATINGDGMLGVVMPHGVLFRAGSEGGIRAGLLKADLIEAVVGLPLNLFYGTPIPASILVMSRKKRPERKNRVLFIDASRDFREGTAQSYLRNEDVTKIAAAFNTFSDVKGYARVVELAEIARNEWDLSILRYIETGDEPESMDVRAAILRLRALEQARNEAAQRMYGFLGKLGYDS